MKLVVVIASVSVLIASHAGAAPSTPSLTTTISAPAVNVYATGVYQTTVVNTGPKDATATTLTIAFPATHTSPQQFVMGVLPPAPFWTASSGVTCTWSNSTRALTCALGNVKRNSGNMKRVSFSIALPHSAAPIVFTATASTISNGGDSDTASVAANVRYVSVTGYPAHNTTATNRHCTGTGLTAFFECTRFPSSLSSHTADFQSFSIANTSGTITFAGYPDFSGTWTRSGTHLAFQYLDRGVLVASFEGEGVRSTATQHCYEGVTRFPDGMGGWSPYVSPYEVCFAPTAP